MPNKHPNTERWGGPGASHEDRTKTPPDPRTNPGPDEPSNLKFSQVSTGGGERDGRHSHDPKLKRDFEQNSEARSRPNSDGIVSPAPTPQTRDRTEH